MSAPEGYAYETGPLRLEQIRRAGVEVREAPPRLSFGSPETFVPLWAYLVCEVTSAAGPLRPWALQRGAADAEFAEALVASWRLGGAAVLLVGVRDRESLEASR